MIAVSDTWRKIQQQFLLPETFLEISCGIGDVGIQDLLDVTGSNEAVFSNTQNLVESLSEAPATKYATLEHNLWVLDGSRSTEPYIAPGYANDKGLPASVTFTLPQVRNVPIPGLTITWSSEHGEYPTAFSVEAKNGDTVVASATVNDNTSSTTELDLEIVDYDSLTITVHEWCLPDHRVRIDTVSFGHILTFTKKDVLSFTHEQQGNLNSGELSKNSIEFTLDNVDGRWNPHNPAGIEKYLSERQRVTVRYGLDVGGSTEWIKAGTFYLSEWKAPANGLEASFAARDIFEYMLNEPYTGLETGTLSQLVSEAFKSAGVPGDFVAVVDPSLDNYTATLTDTYTAAEVVQMCANAACCAAWQDREGVLRIEPINKTMSGYSIGANQSYAHPEVALSKPLKSVSVAYGTEQKFLLNVGNAGETQTVDNPLVGNAAQAEAVAEWVRDTLELRKTVSGEYRADPRLDLFDIVSVDSKYGVIVPVAITDIRYTYSGSFRGNYSGRVISGVSSTVLGNFILGQSVLG